MKRAAKKEIARDRRDARKFLVWIAGLAGRFPDKNAGFAMIARCLRDHHEVYGATIRYPRKLRGVTC